MPEPNFIDYVKLYMRAGHGGAGSVHFRRQRFIPKGGPDGGDGGRGGHIILVGNPQCTTLLHLKYRKHIHAEDGGAGAGARCKGRDGGDVILQVPLGTVAKEAETGKVVSEVTQANERIILLEGGKGGWGNDHFKSATKQAPRYAQPGRVGQEKVIILELKLIAAVGLIGAPNAGKSTLLSTISAAKPKIADYPFTTLQPQLGIVSYQGHTFTVAEIPGLIVGAASGRGLGTRFLRHAERNGILLFVIPADTHDYAAYYKVLEKELQAYKRDFSQKKFLIAISKIDLVTPQVLAQKLARLPAGVEYICFSSHTQHGIAMLKKKLWQCLSEQ